MAERKVQSSAYQIKATRFPAYKDLAGFDFASSEINEAMIRQLYRGEFMGSADKVVLIGRPGTGKTHIATALGVQAAEHHRKNVRFTAMAPTTSNCRSRSLPVLLIRPRRCFPPVECSRGVGPSDRLACGRRRKNFKRQPANFFEILLSHNILLGMKRPRLQPRQTQLAQPFGNRALRHMNRKPARDLRAQMYALPARNCNDRFVLKLSLRPHDLGSRVF